MKTIHAQMEKLRKYLADVHAAKENLEVGEEWKQKVIARIREVERNNLQAPFVPLFGQYAWRIVPLTLAMCAVLSFMLFHLHYTTEYDCVQLLVSYVEQLTVHHIYGI